MPDLTYHPTVSNRKPGRGEEFYYLGYIGWRLVTSHIPQLVVLSNLVELRLHFAHSLPISRNWTRFFTPMSHLRTLDIGGGALVMAIMGAFEADPSLCAQLQDLALCIFTGPGPVREEEDTLFFFRDVVGTWVRNRAVAGPTCLRKLTVRTPVDASSCTWDGCENARPGGVVQGHEVEPVGFAAKLRRGLTVWLRRQVEKVVVEAQDCPACSAEYAQPLIPPDPLDAVFDYDEGSGDAEGDPYFY